MSLIDRINTTVLVQNRVYKAGPRPVWENNGEPISVPVRLITVSSSEAEANGLTVSTMKRLLVRPNGWPGDFRSLVTIGASTWEPLGDPQVFNNSVMTTHIEVTLKLVSRG